MSITTTGAKAVTVGDVTGDGLADLVIGTATGTGVYANQA